MNTNEKMWEWLNAVTCARCGINKLKEDSDWCVECRPEEKLQDEETNIS